MRALFSRIVLSLVLVGMAAGVGRADDKPRVFMAGAATSNITPDIGEIVVGGFSPFPSAHVHDDLHARCIVLDDGQTRIGLVVCDILTVTREVCDAAKQLANEKCGLPIDRIMISATHTHSGPSARPSKRYNIGEELTDYQKYLVRRIADGLVRAQNNLEPARIGWGVGNEPNQVFNRRWYMTPGPHTANPFGGIDQVRMNPPSGSADLIEPAGPTDPEVSFISIQSTAGRPIALLANYSLHYVGGVGRAHISADYFGMFADRIQYLLGADRLDPPFVGVMSNGTSGDVNNIDRQPTGPSPRREPYEKMRLVANALAAEVYRVHQSIVFHDWVPLDMVTRELTLEVRKPTPEVLERARALVAGKIEASHSRDLNYAERTIVLHDEAPSHVDIVLQAIRIGDLGIATTPFETFTETGLEIKARSPFKPTFTIELANGGYGYLPTPEQHRLGGYETWLGTNYVEVNASRKMTDLLISMLEELKSKDAATQ